MKTSLILPALITALTALPAAGTAAQQELRDLLETPAKISPLAVSSHINRVTASGPGRYVAVGPHGHVLISGDAGQTWKQVAVPVSTDLVSVHFVSATKGWVVGHDGVVLHTQDGGSTWQKQLDGRVAAAQMLEYYQRKAAERGEDERLKHVLEEAAYFVQDGPDKPFLDVWFDDENNGFIIGAFNLIFRTRDGGRSWEPWYDRVENETGLHLHAIRRVGSELLIVGEQGLMLRLDPALERFVKVDTPYAGSYFGLLGRPGLLVIYGLRGHAFSSPDMGRSWTRLETGIDTSITGATFTETGELVLVSQGARALVSRDDGKSFSTLDIGQPMPLYDVAAGRKGELVLAGARGLRTVPLR
jgi:photosystem II stability/assembly factor-like uncharacterized protein